MTLLGGVLSVKGMAFLMFSILIVTALGYMLGRITIKGVSLGTAGVFIVALLYGALFYEDLAAVLKTPELTSQSLKVVEQLGLIFFVTAVGFIAGPKFFKNLKKNFKSYILLGLIIILSGGLVTVGCYYFGTATGLGMGDLESKAEFMAMLDGLLSGALTTTPGFSAAKEAAPEFEAAITVGHGIAYLFGVVGVVLFVQLIPKIMKADMDAERAKLVDADTAEVKEYTGKLINIDDMGLGAFALAAILGVLLGSIKIPLTSAGFGGTCFSLGTTGGTLIMSLIFGHFSHIGPINVMPPKPTLQVLRELGLMLFLIGAGVAGGADFVKYFEPIYFVYGAIMTTVPMIIGFLFAKYVLKLSLLNNLGSITGGMTSTPALGTLIGVAKTEEVASAYAATYPISLLAIVLVSQFLMIIWG
ncbi:MAG: permease [Ruminococcaceae bacterium]|nr:permease [Oscillospiraceae bacterium]